MAYICRTAEGAEVNGEGAEDCMRLRETAERHLLVRAYADSVDDEVTMHTPADGRNRYVAHKLTPKKQLMR